MIFTLAVTASLLTPAADPPTSKELFAKVEWYRNQKEKEQAFIGVLEYLPRPESAVGQYNPYRLSMGDKKVREVYVADDEKPLKEYVGYTLKLTGKAVERNDGAVKHAEIWPGYIELVPAPPKVDPKKERDR
jgi:hypothetical protein